MGNLPPGGFPQPPNRGREEDKKKEGMKGAGMKQNFQKEKRIKEMLQP